MIKNEVILLAKSGDIDALEKIISEYKNLIFIKNKTLFLKGAERDDLIQEGMIGLIKAIKSFDETKNACFSTFASLCIRRQIITAVKTYSSAKYKNLNTALQVENSIELENIFKYKNPSLKYHSPEQLTIGKELMNLLQQYLEENLSSLEKKVFSEMANGFTYIEIATHLNKEPKTVDNSIQRIKKKVSFFLKNYNKN